MIKALQPDFILAKIPRRQMRFTMLSVFVNSALAISLFPLIAERGIATAEVAAGGINTVLLFTTLLRRGDLQWEWALARRAALLLVATGVMCVALTYGLDYAKPWLMPGTPLVQKVTALFALIGVRWLSTSLRPS